MTFMKKVLVLATLTICTTWCAEWMSRFPVIFVGYQETAVMACSVDVASFKGFFNNNGTKIIEKEGRYKIEETDASTRTLEIFKTVESDFGKYYCADSASNASIELKISACQDNSSVKEECTKHKHFCNMDGEFGKIFRSQCKETCGLCVIEPITMIPDGSIFPVEGSKVFLMCIVVDLKRNKSREAWLEDGLSRNITSTDRIKMERKKFEENATTILKLTFDPIKMGDIQEIQCRSHDIGRVLSVRTIPKSSLPNIMLTPAGRVSAKKGLQKIFVCSISTLIQKPIKSVSLKWTFINNLQGVNAQEINVNRTKNWITSTLAINKVHRYNIGVYRCSAILTSIDGEESKVNTFFKDVFIDEVVYIGENTSEEIKSVLYNDVTLDCNVLTVPMATITWFKNGTNIINESSSHYVFSKQNASSPGNRMLTIKNITANDSGIYKCEATRKFDVLVKNFKLIVKGATSNEENTDSDGVDDGDIAIIVISILLVVIVVICILLFCFRFKEIRKRKAENADAATTANLEYDKLNEKVQVAVIES